MHVAPRLYVDSAQPDGVVGLLASGVVFGVTTNPTILERDGRSRSELPELYAAWVDAGAREVFFQTWGEDPSSMLANADDLLAVGERVGVKVPATKAGFAAARSLVDAGATVLVTAVYSVGQALASAAIGANYIAPYLGRLRDAGHDGTALIARMQQVCAGSQTNVLAASLRTPADIVDLRLAGVPYFTAAPKVILALLHDEMTDRVAAEFEDAIGRIAD